MIIIGPAEVVLGTLAAASVILLLISLYVKLINGEPLFYNTPNDPPEVAQHLKATKEDKERKLAEKNRRAEAKRQFEKMMADDRMQRMLDSQNKS